MSIRKVSFVFGEYYHIYNRGNSKQKIFHNKEDYSYFVKLLHVLNQKNNKQVRDHAHNIFISHKNDNPLVAIGAYVLMPNHFHILITPTEEGSVSKYMQKVCTGYVMYYNQKYKRSGSLFEGKFKSQHTNNDIYLKYLFSYIHLNPVKLINNKWKENGIKNTKKTLDFLNTYKYSSYLDYVSENKRPQNFLLNRKVFPGYFPNSKEFQNEILDWIKYNH
jgi:putative transposase